MITIPDGMRRPAEVERDELKKQLAEARAEIERKDKLIEQMREVLKWHCAACPDTNDYGDKRHCEECKIKTLLDAAARSVKE